MPSALLPVTVFLACVTTSLAIAQDLRVYTTVSGAKGQVIARSLTLFHAGKVYDYIDPVQELTIHEPAHERFLVLHQRRMRSTEVTHEEIGHYLQMAHMEAEKHLETAVGESSPGAFAAMQALQFQLNPTFRADYNAKSRTLSLTSDVFRYRIGCVDAVTSENVDRYLHYADWVTRLNSVLHPQSPLPGPRLEVNAQLKKYRVLPLSVDLAIQNVEPIRLKAEHTWTWELSAKDRELIHHWETTLKDPAVKALPFPLFQKETLTAGVARARD